MEVAVDEYHLGRKARNWASTEPAANDPHTAQTQATSSGSTPGLPAKTFYGAEGVAAWVSRSMAMEAPHA